MSFSSVFIQNSDEGLTVILWMKSGLTGLLREKLLS